METQAEAVMADSFGLDAQYQSRDSAEPFAVRIIEMAPEQRIANGILIEADRLGLELAALPEFIAPRQGDTITEIGGDARVWEVDTFERQGARWTIYPRRRR
jgi:hypothetical protein